MLVAMQQEVSIKSFVLSLPSTAPCRPLEHCSSRGFPPQLPAAEMQMACMRVRCANPAYDYVKSYTECASDPAIVTDWHDSQNAVLFERLQVAKDYSSQT